MYNTEESSLFDRRLISEDCVDPAYIINGHRRSALAAIDNANFSWFHVKICLVAGIGFFTESYDTFAINIASEMLGYLYGTGLSHGQNTPSLSQLSQKQGLGIKVATSVGTLFGQLLFGWLADKFGRKRMYGIELLIIIIATFGQAISGGAHAIDIISVLIVWRFILGVGIGGDYPISAVISSEFASTRTRGRMMTAVFTSQGWGNFAAALVAFIVVTAYKGALQADSPTMPVHVDFLWRLLIGLGCVPGAVALYFRLTISESPRFTMDIQRNIIQASTDIDNILSKGRSSVNPDAIIRADVPRATWADFKQHFSQWKNLKILVGTSYSWFVLDIAFYGLGLNSSIILQAIGKSAKGSDSIYNNLSEICTGNLILSAAGLIPGYYFSFLFIDSWGRKPIQLMGFIMLTILFLILGSGYKKLTETIPATHGFIVLLCFTNFFQNFGPNVTTFVIPGEVFPTRFRSTAYGISAASGKLGAVVAQVGFASIRGKDKSIGYILAALSFFMLTGVGSTLLLPETMGKTLEELSNESQVNFVTGVTGMTEVENGIRMTQILPMVQP